MNKHTNFKIEHHSDYKFPFSIYNLEVNSTSSLTPQYHDNFEIIYVTSGKIDVQIGNEIYHADGHSLFFANSYQVHSAQSADGQPGTFHAIVFDKKILEMVNLNDYYLAFIKPFIDGKRRFPPQIPPDTELYSILSDSMDLIIQEYNKRNIAYEIFIKTELERLFAIFVRYHKFFGHEEMNSIPVLHQELMDSLMDYIKDNFQNKITLDEISKFLNINKHYFCRLVKRITGKSFTEFLNMYRISQAEALIQSKNISITTVAEMSGFTNLSYFNRVFLKYTGYTPRMCRKMSKT